MRKHNRLPAAPLALALLVGAPVAVHAQTAPIAIGGLNAGAFQPGPAMTLWVSGAALNVCATVSVPVLGSNANPAITVKLLPSGATATIQAGPSLGSGTLTGPTTYKSGSVCAANSTSLTITANTTGGSYAVNSIPHVP